MKNKFMPPGIKDEYFIRGKVPMTKAEVRAVVMSKLCLTGNEVIVDIGAGTGSISIESALMVPSGRVFSIERNQEAVELINANCKCFEVNNVQVLQGAAMDVLPPNLEVDRIVIGGSGGQLNDILEWSRRNLRDSGVLIVTAILLDTLTDSIAYFKSHGFEFKVTQVSITPLESLGDKLMFKANNPIFIIEATKSERG